LFLFIILFNSLLKKWLGDLEKNRTCCLEFAFWEQKAQFPFYSCIFTKKRIFVNGWKKNNINNYCKIVNYEKSAVAVKNVLFLLNIAI